MHIKRDGGWAWVVFASVIISQTILGGVCISGGLFYVIFIDAYGSRPVEVSILCSLPITVWLLSSPFGSYLSNKYGYRICAVVGGIVVTSGLALSFFTADLNVLFFSYGILTGLGFGINYTGCIASLNVYFDRYKTIVTGISAVGHNIGIIIFAELVIFLDENYGWRGMLLILSGLTFNLCACALVMFPLCVKRKTSIDCNITSRNIMLYKNVCPKRHVLAVSVCRKLSFICFCASNLLSSLSHCILLLYLPSYSENVGFTRKNFGTLIIVYSTSNIVGKAFFSGLCHNPKINCSLVYMIALSIAGISMGLTPVVSSKAGLFVTTSICGFFLSVSGALMHAVIHSIVGFDRFTDGVGLSLPFKATGNFVGGPVVGMLVESCGSYTSSFYIAGICLILSSLLMLYPTAHERQRKKSENNIYIACETNMHKCEQDDYSIEPFEHIQDKK